MRALEFLTGYVTFKLHYDQIYQLKTTNTIVFGTNNWDVETYKNKLEKYYNSTGC